MKNLTDLELMALGNGKTAGIRPLFEQNRLGGSDSGRLLYVEQESFLPDPVRK